MLDNRNYYNRQLYLHESSRRSEADRALRLSCSPRHATIDTLEDARLKAQSPQKGGLPNLYQLIGLQELIPGKQIDRSGFSLKDGIENQARKESASAREAIKSSARAIKDSETKRIVATR